MDLRAEFSLHLVSDYFRGQAELELLEQNLLVVGGDAPVSDHAMLVVDLKPAE